MAAMTTSDSSVDRRARAIGEVEAPSYDGPRPRRRGGRRRGGGGRRCRRRRGRGGGRRRSELLGHEAVGGLVGSRTRLPLDPLDRGLVERRPAERSLGVLGRLEPQEAVGLPAIDDDLLGGSKATSSPGGPMPQRSRRPAPRRRALRDGEEPGDAALAPRRAGGELVGRLPASVADSTASGSGPRPERRGRRTRSASPSGSSTAHVPARRRPATPARGRARCRGPAAPRPRARRPRRR